MDKYSFDRKPHPAETANVFSILLSLYIFPIFKYAYKYELTEDDLFRPLEVHRSHKLGEELEESWYREYRTHKKSALHRALFKMFGFGFTLFGLAKLFDEIMLIVAVPQCIGKLISYFGLEKSQISKTEAFIYSGGLLVCLFVHSILAHPSYLGMQHTGMKIRVACTAFIYRKMLKFSQKSLMGITTGQLVNLLSNDVNKFDESFMLVHFIWVGPVQVVVGTYLLYREIGNGAFYGIAFLCIFVPFQIYLAQMCSSIRLKTALRTDERVRLMNEVITGIQVIKMYCWEKPFSMLIRAARQTEIKQVLLHSYVIGLIYSFEIFIARTSIFISILAYVLLGNYVTAEKVFSVTAIYNILRPTITMMFSLSVGAIAQINISLLRLHKIFEYEEFRKDDDYTKIIRKKKRDINPRVIFKNVFAKWSNDATEDTLINISFDITSKGLLAITGPVGGGKSSIIYVILNELPVRRGNLEVYGIISYFSQDPWLFNSSIRENIIFGENFDYQRYKHVLHVCALRDDIEALPWGDRTLVGERGKSLSGGQRARVSLARCVYRIADIYLLDDPLSAVDAKVAKHIYEKCISSFLSDKICILVTHQLQFLKDAEEKIIVIDDGEVQITGNYSEIQSSGKDFVTMRRSSVRRSSVRDEDKLKKIKRDTSSLIMDANEEGQEIEREFIETGYISFGTYITYFRAGGNWFNIIFLAVLFIGNQIVANGGEFFLTYWVNLEQENAEKRLNNQPTTEINRHLIIIQYTILIVGMIAFSVMKSIYYMTFLTHASKKLHDKMYTKIQWAPMTFFDINPSGRILNRFSKDLGCVDEYIPSVLLDVFESALQLLGVIILGAMIEPYLLIVDACSLVMFYLLKVVYSQTSRNVKRIEAITKSPMFSHMTATLAGLDTIRAFGAQNMLIQQFDSLQDVHSAAWYLYIECGKCFGLWLDFVCQLFIASVILVVLILENSILGGDMGLIITQYIFLMNSLQWGLRQWTELDNNMTSVERLIEYTKVETEPVREKFSKFRVPLVDWPEEGHIEFRNVSLCYNEQDSYVLSNIDFKVMPTEKVGIVGRTGAGKSSIITALFQLYPIEGSVMIDNLDITKMPLDIVRSKLSIIPQSPFLFSGSIRQNLDPFKEYSDDVLWRALDQVDLREDIQELATGLNTLVSEGGKNLSVGQRQLVCLARALIRNNRILVLDEATANIDPYTDALIQRTIRKKFSHCTILTVAHRLHTVMDADKILVIDRGIVQEYDNPYILLQNKDGFLRKLVQATGPTTARYLEETAKEGLSRMLYDMLFEFEPELFKDN